MRRLLQWLFLIAIGLVTGAHAESVSAPRRLALLIGNWDYNANGKFDRDPPPELQGDLRNPCHDVELLKSTLQKVKFGEIVGVCNLTKSQFDDRIAELSRKFEELPSGSVLFIYFSGHGVQQYGRIFSLPVLFRLSDKVQQSAINDQIQYMSAHAVDVQTMLGQFSERKDLAIYIALDQCRNEALEKKDDFNNAVRIATAENVMIQYSAAAGDESPDGEGNSDFSKLLSREIARGGDLPSIAGRVWGESLRLYREGRTKTYSAASSGLDFAQLRSPAMTLSAADPTSSPSATSARLSNGAVDRRKRELRSTYDNPSLDIFWCEGEGEEARYATAFDLGKKIAKRAKQLGVGRVMVKPLPVHTNLNSGYNAWRNLMRYDPSEDKERLLLENIAAQFPELGFLPQRGAGAHGAPTAGYMSAFICKGFAGR